MNSVDKIQFSLFYGEEIDLFGGHEMVKVRTLGKFDDEDRDNFYSLLESDGVG
ncbi:MULTISPECIES: hypothetical protein [Paenibacillus]|uniref:hypothetical protein n=1 Tax=Paenibacillus TaxID=44249 RepID=UPI001649C121|nr:MULTISPECIES: hypothetical protein [Paenibacillus]